jgi:hypothetical protein
MEQKQAVLDKNLFQIHRGKTWYSLRPGIPLSTAGYDTLLESS